MPLQVKLFKVFFVILLLAIFDITRISLCAKRFQIFAVAGLLIILAATRSVGTGSDDEAYLEIFSSISNSLPCSDLLCGYSYEKYNVEVGFFLLLLILSLIGSSAIWLFGAIATLTVTLNIKTINFFSPYLGSSVLVYFSHYYLAKDLNAIRAGAASALVFFVAVHLAREKYLLATFLFLIALSFHITSLIFLMPLVLILLKPNKKHFMIGLVVVLAFSASINISDLLSTVFNTSFLGEKFQSYVNSEQYSYSLYLFDQVNVKNLVLILIALIFWEKLSMKFEHFHLVFCCFFASSSFRLLFSDFAIVAGRGYSVIGMFEFLLVPYLAFGILGRALGLIAVVIYSFAILVLNLYVNTGWSNVL